MRIRDFTGASVLLAIALAAASGHAQTVGIPPISIGEQQIAFAPSQYRPWLPAVKTTAPEWDKPASCETVENLAKEFRLRTAPQRNPHLAFRRGDLSYWCEEKLSETELRLEFAARRIVLDAADKSGAVIRDQGVLSWAAQRVMPDIKAAALAGSK